MTGESRSPNDLFVENEHLDAHSKSTLACWSAEWQQAARSRNTFGDKLTTNDSASNHIPLLELTGNSDRVHNLTVHNDGKGLSDTVAGINPGQGESLSHLLKRLHPDLSDEQLAKEVQKVLKYNRDYGNELGDGHKLDSSKSVFLTSVKYVDEKGRITRVESPTGIVTAVSYDGAGMSGYKITGPDGKTVIEEAHKDSGGKWTAVRDGQAVKIAAVEMDIYGDITVTGADGNKVAHLTRGDDVYTRFNNGKPVESTTLRNGEQQVSFEYDAVDGGYKIYARYPSDPDRRVLITPELDEESVKRITLALGQGPKAYAARVREMEPESGDPAPDEYVAGSIVNAAIRSANAHHSVGWCYAGVADALDKIGVHLHGEYAYMAKDQLLHDKRFQVVSINDLRPGDVLVHGASGAHTSGHIAVYLGRGQEASDHIQSLIRGQGYGGTTVFRFVGDKASEG